jgi:cytochrome c553
VFAAFALLGSVLIGKVGAAPPQVARLDQGWGTTQEQSFYFTPQGTVIMPVSWLAALDAADGTPLMSPEHMRALGFLYDDHKSPANPNDWPIGFAIDSGAKTGGVPTAGFTCAACHTSQLTYRGSALRVDGGQSNINLDAFKKLLSDAILATGADPARRAAFEQRAIALGFPKEKMDPAFEQRYQGLLKNGPASKAYAAHMTMAGPGRNDALAAIAVTVFNSDLGVPTNTNQATAPVDYPYLWNISNLYWVQYNGSVRQPMARNIGEALGVGAVTNFIDPATGNLNPEPDRWRTSIPIGNLYTIETLLETLKPPVWPSQTLGAIDQAKATAGRALFAQNCAACHAVRSLAGTPGNEWSVKVLPLKTIGTDPRQAENFSTDTYDASKLGLSSHITAGPGLQVVTEAIKTQAYKDASIPPADWPKFDGFGRKNVLTEPCGYKARPLVGVWSTPPFLHNGSVPSIFALLSESRPATFHVGTSEYDPKHLGFVDATGPQAVAIDTKIVGNSNAGHWFTNDRTRPGRIGRHFSDAEKYDILEYLKSATYADYPHTTVTRPDPEPCVADATAYPEGKY